MQPYDSTVTPDDKAAGFTLHTVVRHPRLMYEPAEQSAVAKPLGEGLRCMKLQTSTGEPWYKLEAFGALPRLEDGQPDEPEWHLIASFDEPSEVDVFVAEKNRVAGRCEGLVLERRVPAAQQTWLSR